MPLWEGATTPRNCSTACSTSATISAFWPKNMIRRNGGKLGNFPQAFSHVGLVNAAHNLMRAEYGPSEQRADRTEPPHSDENPTEEHV